ncbi:glutamate receptor ionotropic, delta-2-like [Nilaparvata lugens]|uniref:glutamate receptor ionotropic, delta-2-like n=1 Tax=Nilaparvata lugens TaxID=108931 RepID=UPI00193E21C2|nr:glutamate receptor ionotropic, delta-2-like [Nilaparvata lugens]
MVFHAKLYIAIYINKVRNQSINQSSSTGVLGIVFEGKAHLGFSALYLWFNEYQYLDYSVSYIRTGITCLVPRAQLISPWLLPIQPFDKALWTIVVMTLVTSTITLYYVSKITNIFSRNWRRRFRTVDDSMLRVIGMLVLQVPTAKGIRPPPTALRYVITFLEVMFLLVVTSYHSGLASVLTLHSSQGNWRRRFRTVDDSMLRVIGMLVLQVPTAKGIRPPPTALRYVITFLEVMFLLVVTSYHSGLASVLTLHRHEAAIETVQDLVDSGLEWGATHDAWIFSILLSPEQRTKTLVERFKVLSEKKLNERTQTRNFAFSLERLQGGYFAIGDYITEESMNHLQLMKEDIYYEYCVYALPKGSPYKEPLDKLILDIQSAGLVLHWEGEVVRNYLPVKVQYGVAQSSASPTESEPIVLQLKHIHGALTILAIGLTSSTLIFITEVFWNKDLQKHREERVSSHLAMLR